MQGPALRAGAGKKFEPFDRPSTCTWSNLRKKLPERADVALLKTSRLRGRLPVAGAGTKSARHLQRPVTQIFLWFWSSLLLVVAAVVILPPWDPRNIVLLPAHEVTRLQQ